MKEIKIATLTKEEIKELRELSKMREKGEIIMAQSASAKAAFWQKVTLEHSLPLGPHYIKPTDNSIYRQE